MALPSGTGSEILKSNLQNTTGTTLSLVDNTATGIWIATIISVSICNVHASEDGVVSLFINDGSNDRFLLKKQSLPAENSFVYNDKVVISDGETLKFYRETSAGNFDVVTSYILQDWS